MLSGAHSKILGELAWHCQLEWLQVSGHEGKAQKCIDSLGQSPADPAAPPFGQHEPVMGKLLSINMLQECELTMAM